REPNGGPASSKGGHPPRGPSRWRAPEAHGGEAPPWSPRLGSLEQFGRRRTSFPPRHRTQQTEIRGRERIRLTKRSHGDILRGPRPNTRQGLKLRDGGLERLEWTKQIGILRHRTG